jgi:predicted negative regulator of RcsB-dependent stress response
MAEEYLTDDEQLEAVKHAFVEYAPWLIGGALVGAILLFGYRYFENYTEGRALKAAAQFNAMTAALQTGNSAKSRQIAEALIQDFPSSPYADQAQLTLARLDVDGGEPNKAIPPLTRVMTESKDTQLRQIARLRLARLLIDQGKPDEAISTLAGPVPAAFAGPFHEVLGDAFAAKKDPQHAVGQYREAVVAAAVAGINTSLLELKIQDLGKVSPAPAPPSDTSIKVKP